MAERSVVAIARGRKTRGTRQEGEIQRLGTERVRALRLTSDAWPDDPTATVTFGMDVVDADGVTNTTVARARSGALARDGGMPVIFLPKDVPGGIARVFIRPDGATDVNAGVTAELDEPGVLTVAKRD